MIPTAWRRPSSPARIAAVCAPSEKPTSPRRCRVDILAAREQVEGAPGVHDERAEALRVVRLRDRERYDSAHHELCGDPEQIAAAAAGAVQEEHGRMAAGAPRDEQVAGQPRSARACERHGAHGAARARRDHGAVPLGKWARPVVAEGIVCGRGVWVLRAAGREHEGRGDQAARREPRPHRASPRRPPRRRRRDLLRRPEAGAAGRSAPRCGRDHGRSTWRAARSRDR